MKAIFNKVIIFLLGDDWRDYKASLEQTFLPNTPTAREVQELSELHKERLNQLDRKIDKHAYVMIAFLLFVSLFIYSQPIVEYRLPVLFLVVGLSVGIAIAFSSKSILLAGMLLMGLMYVTYSANRR